MCTCKMGILDHAWHMHSSIVKESHQFKLDYVIMSYLIVNDDLPGNSVHMILRKHQWLGQSLHLHCSTNGQVFYS